MNCKSNEISDNNQPDNSYDNIDTDISDTGSASTKLVVLSLVSSAAAAAYVVITRKKKEEN